MSWNPQPASCPLPRAPSPRWPARLPGPSPRTQVAAAGDPAIAQVAKPTGYPEAARDPGRAGQLRARGTTVPTGYPQARGAGSAGHPAIARDATPTGWPQAGHRPASGAAGPAWPLKAAHD